ncbi:MAG: DUF4168 domain-containing protein [Leptolyngbyaceae bacterium]|nr:DUF4168 domain-containing protein [Leptolyngbyaceae bacterium]
MIMFTFFLHQFFAPRQNGGGRGKLIALFLVGLSIVSAVPLLGLKDGQPHQSMTLHHTKEKLAPTVMPKLSLGQVAYAQEQMAAETIDNYAEAVLNIEQIRTDTFATITTLMAPDPVPSIACNQEDSIRDLPNDVQDLVVDFCQTSIALVEATGLTVPEFNQITADQAGDPALFDAIQEALTRLQTPASDGMTEAEPGDDINATTEDS